MPSTSLLFKMLSSHSSTVSLPFSTVLLQKKNIGTAHESEWIQNACFTSLPLSQSYFLFNPTHTLSQQPRKKDTENVQWLDAGFIKSLNAHTLKCRLSYATQLSRWSLHQFNGPQVLELNTISIAWSDSVKYVFYHEQISKAAKMKRIPTLLLACDVIMQKTYSRRN